MLLLISIKFIMSEDGQKVVEDNGYISQGNEALTPLPA